jgi:hypothetical protein
MGNGAIYYLFGSYLMTFAPLRDGVEYQRNPSQVQKSDISVPPPVIVHRGNLLWLPLSGYFL